MRHLDHNPLVVEVPHSPLNAALILIVTMVGNDLNFFDLVMVLSNSAHTLSQPNTHNEIARRGSTTSVKNE